MAEPITHESLVEEVEALEKTLAELRERIEEAGKRPQRGDEFLRAYV